MMLSSSCIGPRREIMMVGKLAAAAANTTRRGRCFLNQRIQVFSALPDAHSQSKVVDSSFESTLESKNAAPRGIITNDDSNQRNHHRPFFRIYYNDVYEVPLPPNHRFPMEKYRKVRLMLQEWLQQENDNAAVVVDCDFCVSPLATVQELTTTHSPAYVQRFLSGQQSEAEQRNVGFPWSPQGVNRALSSVGGTVAAACDVCEKWQVMKREMKNQQQHQKQENNYDTHPRNSSLASTAMQLPAPWAAHVAGGTHHAFEDYGEGFCVFSDMAVAANVVRRRYPNLIRRILFVDLDVHQGNGNAVLFQNDPHVFTFSLHCSANYFSAKQKSSLDIELPLHCDDQTYLTTLRYWLKQFLKQQQQMMTEQGSPYFDLIFFQAGVDIIKQDRLGRMHVSEAGVQRRNELVFSWAHDMNVPLVITMGGGYPANKDDWSPILQSHASVYFQAHQFLVARQERDCQTENTLEY